MKTPILAAIVSIHTTLVFGQAMTPCGTVLVDPIPSTTITWTPIAGAVNYEMQIAQNAGFFPPDIMVTTPNLTTSVGLQYGRTYYCRFRGFNAQDWGSFSTPCSFTTISSITQSPAAAPTLNSPYDNVCGWQNPIGFSWYSVGGASTYEIQIATDPAFTGTTSNMDDDTYFQANWLIAGQTYYWRVRGTNAVGNGPWSAVRNVSLQTVATPLNLKVLLHGPLNLTTYLMNDNLRASGLLPTTQPYSALGYTDLENTGSITTGVMTTTGDNAPVDWLLVQAKHGLTNTVIKTWPLVVQRDGDVVMPNGTNPSFFFPMGQVKIALRHRNHLAICTSSNITVNGTAIDLDLTSSSAQLHGTNPVYVIGTTWHAAMWKGDCTGSGDVKYTGSGNDRDPILIAIGSTTPNATVSGYRMEDVNMDGIVKYTGTGNDRDPILTTVGGTTPNNTRTQQLP